MSSLLQQPIAIPNDLVVRAKSCDTAMDRVAKSSWSAVYMLARRSFKHEDACDMTQRILGEKGMIGKLVADYDPSQGSFKTRLIRFAAYEIRSRQRSDTLSNTGRIRRKQIPFATALAYTDSLIHANDSSPTPGEVVLEALNRLPARNQQALRFRYVEDKDPEAIADAFNISETALKCLLYRSRKALRDQLSLMPSGRALLGLS